MDSRRGLLTFCGTLSQRQSRMRRQAHCQGCSQTPPPCRRLKAVLSCSTRSTQALHRCPNPMAKLSRGQAALLCCWPPAQLAIPFGRLLLRVQSQSTWMLRLMLLHTAPLAKVPCQGLSRLRAHLPRHPLCSARLLSFRLGCSLTGALLTWQQVATQQRAGQKNMQNR